MYLFIFLSFLFTHIIGISGNSFLLYRSELSINIISCMKDLLVFNFLNFDLYKNIFTFTCEAYFIYI